MTLVVKFGNTKGGDILTDRSGLVSLGNHGSVIMMMQHERTPRSVLWTRMAIVLAVVLVMIIALVVIWTPPDQRGETVNSAAAGAIVVEPEDSQGEVLAVSDSTKRDSLSDSAGE